MDINKKREILAKLIEKDASFGQFLKDMGSSAWNFISKPFRSPSSIQQGVENAFSGRAQRSQRPPRPAGQNMRSSTGQRLPWGKSYGD